MSGNDDGKEWLQFLFRKAQVRNMQNLP
jgi:hypothetical protein